MSAKDRVRYKLVDKYVNDLLTNFQVKEVPVDIEGICKSLNIEIYCENFSSEDLSGAAIIKGNTKKILVDESNIESRKRFTIAHELGHLMLHNDNRLNVDSQYDVHFRDSRSSTGTEWREVEANYFAASVLMPKNLIMQELDNLEVNFIDDDVVQNLADRFKVSRLAMSIRLGAIGFA